MEVPKEMIQYVNRHSFRLAVNETPFDVSSGNLQVVRGSWDHSAVAVPSILPDRIQVVVDQASVDAHPVAIGRDGKIIVLHSDRFLTLAEGSRRPFALRIVGRHSIWQKFRDVVIAFASAEDEGLAYAPLIHPDLRGIQSWTHADRVDTIIKNMSTHSSLVLDIGAHWGYLCHRLEKEGKFCIAIEIDPVFHAVLLRLRKAASCSFIAVNTCIFEFVKAYNRFDAVLALGIFHHFIKTRKNHAQLVRLLSRLDISEMFFWAHNPTEKQMAGAFRNYAPEEFANFLLDHSVLTGYTSIGVFNERELFRLWR